MSTPAPASGPLGAPPLNTSVGYLAPLLVFGVFTAVEGLLPPWLYPWVYAVKIAAVVITLKIAPQGLQRIHPSAREILPACGVGILVFAQWILLDKWIWYPSLGTRMGFDPFHAFQSGAAVWMFLAVRLVGLVALVPIIEELFWRGFVLRYFTNENFESVPVGTYSTRAFWIVAAGSAATHPEWPVALIAGIAFALLLRSTRSLFAVVVAHAVANAALGAYIIVTHDWRYW